jgi:hypothetical protein
MAKGTEIVAYGRSLGLGGAFYAGEIKPKNSPRSNIRCQQPLKERFACLQCGKLYRTIVTCQANIQTFAKFS